MAADVSDPLAVLQRIRQTRAAPGGAGGGAVRPLRRADPRRARPPRRPPGPQPAVRLPGLLPALHLRGRGRRAATGPCPTATWPSPTSGCPPASGTRCRSRSASRSSSSTRRSAGWPPSTRARPAPPSRSCPSRPGTRWSRPTRCWRRCSPTSRPSWCGPTRTGRSRVLPGADRRLLRTGRAPAPAVARLRRRPRGPRGPRRLLRPGPGAGDDDDRSPSRSSAARPEPHAAVPTIMLRLRVTEADGRRGPRPGPALPDPHRAAAAAVRRQRRKIACTSCSARRPQWGDSLRPFLWTHVSTTIAGFSGLDRVRPARRVHLRLRGGRRQVPPRPGGRRHPAAPPVLGHGLHPGGVGVRGRARLLGPRRRPTGCRSSVWREVMDLYFPNSGWLRVGRDTLDRLQRFKARRALPTWDQAFEQLLKAGRRGRIVSDRRHRPVRGGPGRRRRGALRGVRAVPVPGVVGRTSCAGSSACSDPAGVQRGRRLRALVGAHRVPGRSPGSAAVLDVRIRCLQVQHRAVEALDAETASSRRSTGSRSTARCIVDWDEAVDQIVDLPPLHLSRDGTARHEEAFAFAGGSRTSKLVDPRRTRCRRAVPDVASRSRASVRVDGEPASASRHR